MVKNKFLKLFIVFLVLLNLALFISANAQLNGTFKTVRFVNVLDSTLVTTPVLPPGQDGGIMYYNTQSNKFRLYENGVWRDLGGGGTAIVSSPDQIIFNDAGTLTGNVNLQYDVTDNNFRAGTGGITTIVGTANGNFVGNSSSIIAGQGSITNSTSWGGGNTIVSLPAIGANMSFNLNFSGSGNDIGSTGTIVDHSSIINGLNNNISDLSFATIIGTENLSLTAVNATKAVYMPRIIIGQGTGGTIPAGVGTDNFLTLDPVTGEIEQVAAPGGAIVSSPGQVIANNAGTVEGVDMIWDEALSNIIFSSGNNTLTGDTEFSLMSGQGNDLAGDDAVLNNLITGNANDVTVIGGTAEDLVVTGSDNTIDGTGDVTQSGIFVGSGHTITDANRTAIIAGEDITATQASTVYMPRVIIGQGTGGTIPTGDITDNLITLDPVTGELEQTPSTGKLKFERTFTSLEILSMNSSPVSLIAAPGAGNVIVIHENVMYSYDFITTAYATNDDPILRYSAGQTIGISAFNLLSQGQDTFTTVSSSNTQTNSANVDNLAVEMFVQTGDPTLGDSTFKIIFFYSIESL